MATRWGGFHYREPGPSYVGWGRQIISLSISIYIYIYIYIILYFICSKYIVCIYQLLIVYVILLYTYYTYDIFYTHIVLSYIQLISVLPLPPRRVLSSSPAFCHWPLRAKADRQALQAAKSAESERSSSRSKACSTKTGWNSGNIWGMPIMKGAPEGPFWCHVQERTYGSFWSISMDRLEGTSETRKPVFLLPNDWGFRLTQMNPRFGS